MKPERQGVLNPIWPRWHVLPDSTITTIYLHKSSFYAVSIILPTVWCLCGTFFTFILFVSKSCGLFFLLGRALDAKQVLPVSPLCWQRGIRSEPKTESPTVFFPTPRNFNYRLLQCGFNGTYALSSCLRGFHRYVGGDSVWKHTGFGFRTSPHLGGTLAEQYRFNCRNCDSIWCMVSTLLVLLAFRRWFSSTFLVESRVFHSTLKKASFFDRLAGRILHFGRDLCALHQESGTPAPGILNN